MFDKLKAVSAIGNLMKNQDKIKEAGARIKARLEAMRIQGEAGGGAARAEITGTMKVLHVELSPALVAGMHADDRTRALASGLIAEALNNAISEAQRRMQETIAAEAKEAGLDGLLPDAGALGGLLG